MTSAVPRSGCEATSRIAAGHEQHGHDVARVRDAARALGEQLRPVQDEGELGELRRLELQRPGAEPAPRPVHGHADARQLHGQQADEREREQRLRELDHRVEVAAGHDVHADEADRAVCDVLDEEGGAVALALQQRPRRRRAVDHDRPEREQAQRRGEQEVVLQG
jgi:hypothetical protein